MKGEVDSSIFLTNVSKV